MNERESRGSFTVSSPADALWRLYTLDLVAAGAREHPPAAERHALVEQVGTKLMSRYEFTREMKARPVTQLKDGACPACGQRYHTKHLFASLSGSGEVRGCYTCSRLVTFVADPDNIAGC